ncbi:MAG: AMP-binding protein, partial [Alphaproteobacteria bacterium]
MIDFSHIERNYDLAKTSYSLPIPEEFNFAYDVIDRRAAKADKTALIAIGPDGKKSSTISYSDLSHQSGQFANALKNLGLSKGDFACVVIGRIPEWYGVLFGCMKLGV